MQAHWLVSMADSRQFHQSIKTPPSGGFFMDWKINF
jgi:hypothetical protein